jgi:hypothetical protein
MSRKLSRKPTVKQTVIRRTTGKNDGMSRKPTVAKYFPPLEGEIIYDGIVGFP